MSEERRVVLGLLLMATAVPLTWLGATLFSAFSPPPLALDYSAASVVLLGWLAYFGSKK